MPRPLLLSILGNLLFTLLTIPQSYGVVKHQKLHLGLTGPAIKQEDDAPVLHLKQAVGKELKGDESHRYQLNLLASQFIRVVVVQQGIDVVVVLVNPEGKVLSEIDSPSGTGGQEQLSWVSEKAGSYRLEVRQLNVGAVSAGRYTVELVEQREATPNDRKQVAAEMAQAEGERLRVQGTTDFVLKAVKKYEEAESLWQSIGKRDEEAAALHRQVMALVGVGLLPDALPRAQKALVILEQLYRADEPQVLNGIGLLADVLARQGKYEEARSLLERSLKAVEKKHGVESTTTAQALIFTANITAYIDLDAALSMYERAIKIYEKEPAGGATSVANALIWRANSLWMHGRLADARLQYERALQIYEKSLIPDHPAIVNVLSPLAALLARLGDFSAARTAGERLLRISEKTSGSDSQNVANALLTLSDVLTLAGDRGAMRAAFERALKINEKIFGADSLVAANILMSGGAMLARLDDNPSALAMFERALKIYERMDGPESLMVGNALVAAANALSVKHDLAALRVMYERALKIHTRLQLPTSPIAASTLMSMANTLERRGDETGALNAYEHALKLYEVSEGKNSLIVAQLVISMARINGRLNNAARARAEFERALKIYEQQKGLDAIEVVWVLKELSDLFSEEENFAEGVLVLERALSILEKKYGMESPALVDVLSDLAAASVGQNKLSRARALLERALKILEKTPNPDASEMAECFKGFGTVMLAEGAYTEVDDFLENALKIYSAMPQADDSEVAEMLHLRGYALLAKGDFAAARILFEKGLSIKRKRFGNEDPSTIPMLLGLATISGIQGDLTMALNYVRTAVRIARVKNTFDSGIATALQFAAVAAVEQKKYDIAAEMLNEAISITENALGADHFMVAHILLNQAQLLLETRNYVAAEKVIERIIKIYEASLGAEHHSIGTVLSVKAELLMRQGQMKEARAVLERSLKVVEKGLGPTHFIKAPILNQVGRLDLELNATERGRSSFLAAGVITDFHVKNVLPTLAFAEQRAFLAEELPVYTSELLATCREGAALSQAYELVFRWKGLLIDSLRQQTLIDLLGQMPQHKMQVERLRELRAELAGWYHKAGKTPLAEWQSRNDTLTREKESLERELKRSLRPDEQDDPLAGGLQAFQSLLKSDEVFLDVYFYDSNPKDGPIINHYAAVIIATTGRPVFIDLGSVEKIEAAIKAWRNEVLNGKDGQNAWQNIADLLWVPVINALPPNARKVLVSPDSDLSRIPWHLLPPTNTKTKNLLVSHITSARELARLRLTAQAPARIPSSLLVVGGIDFNASAKEKIAQTERGPFKPLNSTIVEAEAVRALGRKLTAQVTLLKGSDASKDRVRTSLRATSYAHLATHGFFAREPQMPVGKTGIQFRAVDEEAERPRSVRNPLVESGIALAGANAYDPTTLKAEGVLTAEEILGLDLSRCELVTLSACDTGRGEEVTGQGVIGLRASFMAAGTRSLLMSLWKVPDDATAKFMQEFYSNLWEKGMTKAEALRKAQEAVRDDPSGAYKAPVNWAAWMLAGEAW